MKIFRILDELPSLDGFLMRDALELEGVEANEAYFDVLPEERTAIQEFIRSKMEPLVQAAYGGKKPPTNKVTQLIDAMWEAKDLAALDPLVLAFRFPKDEALAIFGAWKGINFYSFQYHQGRQRREALAQWLKEDAMPKNLVPRDVLQVLEPIRRATIERLRGHWVDADNTLKQYDKLYGEFVASSNPGGFISFLRGAKAIYWQLGNSLSKIDHAINCWNIWTKGAPGRRLPFEQLEAMLELLKKILEPTHGRSRQGGLDRVAALNGCAEGAIERDCRRAHRFLGKSLCYQRPTGRRVSCAAVPDRSRASSAPPQARRHRRAAPGSR